MSGRDQANSVVRKQLLHALDVAEQRVETARQGVLRCMHGGCAWNGEQVRRHRADLARAREELDAILQTLEADEQLDAEIGGLP